MKFPKTLLKALKNALTQQLSPLFRYLLPFGSILAALLTQGLIAWFLPKDNDFPFAFFYLVAVFVSAWFGGYIPGSIATVITIVGIPMAVIPHFTMGFVGWSRLLLLLGVSVAISAVSESQKHKRRILEDANNELDRRVQERTADLARAVDDLRESEKRVDFALDAAGIGRLDLDLTTYKATRSLRHDQIFGYDHLLPEWSYRALIDHIVPEDRGEVENNFQAALHHTGHWDFECRIQQPSGEIRWIWGRGKIRRDENGKPSSLLGSIRDITVRKHAEQKLQTQLQRMHLLDQITRAIGERQDLRSIFQTVIRTLEDDMPIDFGCACLYDAMAESMTVTCVGIKSEPLAMDLAVKEQAPMGIDENGLRECIRGRLVYEPDLNALHLPFPTTMHEAGLRSMVVAPLLFESQVFGILVVARRQANGFSSGDCEFLRQLSEHVALAIHQFQLYSALRQAYDDLRQTQQTVMQHERLRALGQMASGIAHDINNAISPIALYMDLLLEHEKGLSTRARTYLETTQRAIDDVAHTVSRMREFYRQHQAQLTLAPVDLNTLIEQIADFTRARWRDIPLQKGMVIQLRMELANNLPNIAGIESEIREALTNLVLNAVDAMPEGGFLTVRTKLADAKAGSMNSYHIAVEVSDTGVGMDNETRLRCLEPFFTTKGDRGTGLGLPMVYGVAQRHGAEIEIDSEPGRGTTMRLNFPVPAMPPKGADPDPAENRVPTRLRLLVVDDDPLLIKSLRDTLESDGHLVVTANHGQEAIDLFTASTGGQEPFSAVITDLGMPHVDGRKVARAIKMASPSTPVILLTGWGQRLVADGEIPPFVDRVLNKPPKVRELRTALMELTAAVPVNTFAD